MKNSLPTLYLEINNQSFIFYVCKVDSQNKFKIIDRLVSPFDSNYNHEIFNFEKLNDTIKENIFVIEQKLNFTFKEIVLVLENFNPIFFNLTGFKKLNGSQVLRENITYIINTLKVYLNDVEKKSKILHIILVCVDALNLTKNEASQN